MVIRRPKDQELEALSTVTRLAREMSTMALWRNPFETLLVPSEDENAEGRGFRSVQVLPREAWRYTIVEFSGESHIRSHLLAQSTALLRRPLVIGFDFVGFGKLPQVLWNPSMHRILQEALFFDDPISAWDLADLQEMRDVFSAFLSFKDVNFDLAKCASKFHELRDIPTHSPLRAIGYFALIESIVAHKPDPKDPTDSLSRQVRQKMVLLSRRFMHPLSTTEFFGQEVSAEALWKSLYSYRSDIAHGAVPDFEKKYQTLGDAHFVARFLARAVSLLLCQVLKEPVLLADLRNC